MERNLQVITILVSILFLVQLLHIPTAVNAKALLSAARSHNYSEALRLSLLYYEAQRSGRLPDDNRIPWRGDSALNDRGQNGEDLTGGYYDAGDFVKFGFTMAFATTILAWGMLSYEDAYIASGQYKYGLEALKWSTDYFIKCHVSPMELYGQVGDFDIDHRFWGRPEDLNTSRPSYKIDQNHPGSDLAGEIAASLAAVSLAYQKVNVEYSRLCLHHAIQLYQFATTYRGLFHEAIKGAAQYYESSDYGDELAWAALWLYKATKDKNYLDDAEHLYTKFRLRYRPDEFSYHKKVAGVQLLLAQLTKRSHYVNSIKAFCDFTINDQTRTPKGLVFIEKSGTLCHAANVALICLQAADLDITPVKYQQFARQQINYMLGDSGRSYVIGYGDDWPQRPFHAASSCPDRPANCTWSALSTPEPNPQVLYGALVSGPDENDFFMDIREEYVYTEVTLDFNAGFQSATAGLKHLQMIEDTDKIWFGQR